ncbi:MAG: hypothetical protein M3N31_01120, partial [Actinomycetota bacterium]|nr:hypothetical protein [Actinomycetota bacterium]
MSGTVTIPRAVFLDVEGVRARRARLVGRAFGVVVAAYLFLSAAAILGAPWVPRVALPGVG